MHKQKRLLTEEKDRLEKETDALKKKVELRELSINDKDYEIKQIKDRQREIE